jgi:hypothetical protein
MSKYHTPLRSAHLQYGPISQERPIIPPLASPEASSRPRTNPTIDSIEEMVREIRDDLQFSADMGSVGVPEGLSLYQPAPEETTPIERPMWQSLVLCVQLHNVDLASELEPAHRLGHISRDRVTLTAEAITTLNYFIDQWYGKEVELVTFELSHHPGPGQGEDPYSAYETPYRPVTGLKLIVTPTHQWAPDTYSQRVLNSKVEWGMASVMEGIRLARSLYIRNKTFPSTNKLTRRTGNPFAILWGAANCRKH